MDTVHGLTNPKPILSYFININPIVSSICTWCLPNDSLHHVFLINFCAQFTDRHEFYITHSSHCSLFETNDKDLIIKFSPYPYYTTFPFSKYLPQQPAFKHSYVTNQLNSEH